MRLQVETAKCGHCREQACMNACPNGLSVDSLNCRHCKPEEAACVLACPKNAFVEVAEGILSIDHSACDGCGLCAEACEFGAITMAKGKASKCDFCAESGFEIQCIDACPLNAIKSKRSRKELDSVERILGWMVFRPEIKKKRLLLEREEYDLIEARDGKKWYVSKPFPELSRHEAGLIKSVLEEFQSENGKENPNLSAKLEEVLERDLIELDEEQREYFHGILFSLVKGFGPLSLLLGDDSLEEIALIGAGRSKPLHVYHRLFGWCNTNIYFVDKESVVNTVNRLLLKTDRRLSLSCPRVNGVLPDGSRINATIPPVSFRQPSFTIRKFHSKKFSSRELVRNGTISAEAMAFLSMAFESDCSVLIAGNTGSGKTTTMNALFSFVPESERIVLVEETPELQIEQKHFVKLNTSPERGIGMSDLIVDSLRMRPDRIVVGEIRNREEVSAFIDTLLAGQGKGSYATFHSSSAGEAVKRLSMLGVKEIDLCGIDLVVVQKRWDKIDLRKGNRREIRRVTEIAELLEKKSSVSIRPIFAFSHSGGVLQKKLKSVRAASKIRNSFSLSRKAMESELKKREKEILRQRK